MAESETAYYIFIGSTVILEDKIVASPRAIKERLEKGYWALSERTPHREKLKPGDRVIFYAAGRSQSIFVGSATLASECQNLPLSRRRELESEFDFVLGAPYGVILKDTSLFVGPVPVVTILRQLSFVGPSRKWGLYFRGGIIKITKKDYELVMSSLHSQ